MAKYALMLPHRPDRYQGLNEDEYMSIIKDYIAWVEDMTEKGIYQGGHKLTDDPGKSLAANGTGVEVHDIPAAEITELLGGLMIIEASDWDAAVGIAKSCPHLRHNERIELREIDTSVDD